MNTSYPQRSILQDSGGSGAQCTAPRPAPPIPGLLADNEKNSGQLWEALCQLEGRLTSVLDLRPATPTSPAEKSPQGGIVNELQKQSRFLDAARSKVSDIIDRLQL